MFSRSLFNLSALTMLASLQAASSSHGSTSSKSQPGMRNIVGPATNWPSGKVHKRAGHYDSGQRPKFKKERKHRQHHHPRRDDNGAYTLTGARVRNVGGMIVKSRRIWLAGISAQRGF